MLRTRRWDLLLAAGASLWHVLAWIGSAVPQPRHPYGLNLLVLCLPTVPLFWRRTHPVVAFIAVALGYLAWLLVAAPDMPGQIAIVFVGVALYSVARHAPPRRSLPAALVMAALLIAPEPFDPPLLSLVVVAFLAVIPAGIWFLGWGQRRLTALTDERAVLTERARIARDLHDVVAHHVSAIAVLARTAEVLVDEDPRAARDSIGIVGDTADTALAEMRRLVGLLRTGPVESLTDLDPLIRPLRAAGCEVTVDIGATIDGMPAASAYRILQEALTNVLKHAAPTTVSVSVAVSSGALSIMVLNGPPGRRRVHSADSGLGLAGIGERAAAFGGEVQAGPYGEGWRVAVTLPVAGR